MTPREFVAVVRERWRAIVACLVLGVLVAVVATLLSPRMYATETTLVVTAQPGDPNAASALDASELSTQRMETYVEVLTSRELARQVVEDLALPLSPDELAGMIAAENPPDTTLLTATVTDSDPTRAVVIADALATRFVTEVADLEQPTDPARAPLVAAAVYADPPPAWVVSPRPVLYLGLGFLLGLVVGIVAALLRHALDGSVRSRAALEDELEAPVRGVLPRAPAVARRPLAILDRPHTPAAEAARQLRTNLGYVGADHEHGEQPRGGAPGRRSPGRSLLVTSARPGEGRTTAVCHLGLAMSAAGYRVLLVDADLRRPALAHRLGIDSGIGLVGVLAEHRPLDRAIRTWEPGIDVLPGGPVPGEPSELLGSPQAAALFAHVRAGYDVVLVDAPPLLPVTDAAVLAPRMDGVLLVVRYGRTTPQQVREARAALDVVSARLAGGVLTMARGVPAGGYAARRGYDRGPGSAAAPAGPEAPPPHADAGVRDPLAGVPLPGPPREPATSTNATSTNGSWRPSPYPRTPAGGSLGPARPGEQDDQ